MHKQLKKILRSVYAIDTQAGHNLRYIIMKALACPAYAEKIYFGDGWVVQDKLYSMFEWQETKEGFLYWSQIDDYLRGEKPEPF